MATDEFNPGLEGIVVAETRLSQIDGEQGELIVGGFPLEELAANASFEESAFLLLNDRLPAANERNTFQEDLSTMREIGDEVRAVRQ